MILSTMKGVRTLSEEDEFVEDINPCPRVYTSEKIRSFMIFDRDQRIKVPKKPN